MPNFDAIASQTVRKAQHLEPAFVRKADVETAARKRKPAYMEAFQLGARTHLASFRRIPPKRVMGLKVEDQRTE